MLSPLVTWVSPPKTIKTSPQGESLQVKSSYISPGLFPEVCGVFFFFYKQIKSTAITCCFFGNPGSPDQQCKRKFPMLGTEILVSLWVFFGGGGKCHPRMFYYHSFKVSVPQSPLLSWPLLDFPLTAIIPGSS